MEKPQKPPTPQIPPSPTLPINSDRIIQKMLYFSGTGFNPSQPLIQKYSVEEITNMLDRNKIQSIDKVYRSKEDGFNLLEFVRFFLNVIEHQEIETLYLTIGIIDFFKEISQASGYRDRLHFIHITNYICNRILDKRNEQNQIQTKHIPDYRTVIPNFKIKDYLLNPPRIYSSKDEVVYKLSLNKIKIDKMKHQGVVTNCQFSSTLMKVFTLDDLSDSISVYNTSCGLIKRIKPHFSKLKKDIVVLSFAYSERQQRIGAVLKDFSINFWDHNDNFQFQKSISTASHCQQYQTNIWFFEYFNAWVTSDKTGHLYIWNLETERPERKIKLAFDTQVNDLAVISCINLIAVVQERKIYIEQKNVLRKRKDVRDDSQACDIVKKDQQENPIIYLYDFLKGQIATKIQLGPQNRNPHTLQYSQNYQVLLSAGYQKKISIYEINKTFLDTSKKGQLTGHQSLITTFTVIKKSPMVVSADDKGKVKIWDIRNYKCVQTLDFRDKTNITKLLDMIQLGKVGVLGSRINFVEFDQKVEIQKRLQIKEKVAPLWIQCDYATEQLIILTKKDLRIIDLRKGVVKNIYCQFHPQDIQITFFKYFEPIQKFVIGNEKGEVKIYCLRTGRFDGKLLDHSGTITHIQYDQQNKIFITMGQDSTIQIQKQQLFPEEREKKGNLVNFQSIRQMSAKSSTISRCTSRIKTNPPKFPNEPNPKIPTIPDPNPNNPQTNYNLILLRQIKNNFHGRELTLGTVSIYHGFIAVGSTAEKSVYIWDYQYCKLLIEIALPETVSAHVQVTCLGFIHGYSVLVIGTSEGVVYFVRIFKMEQSYKVTTIGIYKSPTNQAITHMALDLLIKGFTLDKQKFIHCKVYFGHANGNVTSVDLSTHLLKIKQEASVVHKQNFNAQRQLRQNFVTEIQKKKYQSYTINPSLDDPILGEIYNIGSKKPKKMQDSITAVTFEAHKGSLTGLYVIELDRSYLISIGLDQRVKIWKQANLSCDWNVNLPLPFKWDIEIKNEQKKKDKIMFALKIIQQIFQKFGNQISINESKCLKVRKLLEKVKDEVNQQNLEQNKDNFITEINQKRTCRQSTQKIVLFQNQFTKKDMHYENVKKFNFNEVAGPTLRQIQVQKKLDTIQKQWSMNKQKVEEDKNKLLMVIRNKAQKNEEKQQILQFMQPKQYFGDRNRETQDEVGSSPYVRNVLNQIENLHVPLSTKKDTQGVEAPPAGFNYKLKKQNYTGFSILEKPKLNFSQPKSLRFVENHENAQVFQNMKRGNEYSRSKLSRYTFQKYFEQRQTKNKYKLTPQGQSPLDLQPENPSNPSITKQPNSFRSILLRMNSRVKQSKKSKIRQTANEGGEFKERLLAIATSDGRRSRKMIY